MIDSGLSFLSDIFPDIINKESIVDSMLMGEIISNSSYLLSSKEYPTLVQKQIESMLWHSPSILSIELTLQLVDVQQIFVDSSEELEFDFVIDFHERIYPVHCSYKYLLTE